MAGRDWHSRRAGNRDDSDDEIELSLDDEDDFSEEYDADDSDAPEYLNDRVPDMLLPPPLSFSWRWFTTSLVVLVALFFLEVGIHPAIAAVMLCFKLSLPDLLNAGWLAWRDPRRGRGLLMGMFYAARAFWSAVGYSFGLMMLLAFTTVILANPGRAGPADLEVVGLALAVMFVLMSMAAGACSVLLCLVALIGGVPIWLASEVTPWRRLNHFPPFPPGYDPGKNQVGRFAFVTTIAAVALGMIIGFSTVAIGQPGNGGNPGLAATVLLTIVVGGATSMLVLPRWISTRISATNPSACWRLNAEEWRRVELANGPASAVLRTDNAGDDDTA